MDKTDVKVHENQSDTSSVITMKEYASSEYPSSEPPPAYIKPRSNALRIARLAAFTVIVSSVILGGFILAASWIQANTARNLDLTLNQELLDDLHPSYEHLVADQIPDQADNGVGQESAKNTQVVESTKEKVEEKHENLVPPPPPPHSNQQEEKKSSDLDEIANVLMQKNIKGNVNCIVEKRRNEELVDHAPRSLNLPFGLNITTPPRLQHMTGEQMVVICKGDDEEEKEPEEKEEQWSPMIFPLPSHLNSQINQVPQVIPISQLLQQIPMQQVQQYQVQPQMYQQQPQPLMYHQPYGYPQQVQSQPQPQQMMYPQVFNYQQQHQQPQQQPQQQPIYNNRPEMRYQPEMIPLREVRLNQDQIPMNHIMHNRVPINPMAVKDVPLSQMPLTHLPMKTESQIEEEPMPVHHLVPPQPQEFQAENFNQEEPRFNRPLFRNERPNPYFPQPNRARMNMMEEREPRLIRIQRPLPQETRERFPIFHSNDLESNNFPQNREVDVEENPAPVEGRVLPYPPFEMRAPFPMRSQRLEPERNSEPKVIKMIPLNIENRRPFPRRIRFPDSGESDDNKIPIITEITKIIPIRMINKEEPNMNRIPMIPLSRPTENQVPEIKSFGEIDNKLEKLPERPFPIPINAILDMIFKGIKPLVNNRGGSMPIPIDIKIERIENKPVEGSTGRPLMIEKFEIFEKEPSDSQEDDENDESHEIPEPSTLMLGEVNKAEKPEMTENEQNKDVVEAKVEKVEIFDKEGESTHAIPIPADAQDPQIFKLEEANSTPEPKEQMDAENRAFLPNGQGRGARVFQIPPQFREAKIFSVSDARANKNMNIEIPMESSFSIESAEKPKPTPQTEGRQGRAMNFRQPVEGEINLFPLSEGRAMKPLNIPPQSESQPQTFTIDDARSVRLYPVTDNLSEGVESKPVSVPVANAENSQEMRPHYVQPRSV